jgi:ribonuclease P protein component
MVSAPACAPGPEERSSSAAGSRVAIASPRELECELGRPYRSLKKSSQFTAAYRSGARRRCGAVTIVAASGPAGLATVGFVAGRKVGHAVLRNRAKRRLRAAAAQNQLERDTTYVVIADRGVLDVEFAQLVGWIGRCLEKMSLAGEAG